MSDKAIFDSLSPAQIKVLSNVAFGGSGGYCNPKTLRSLEERGLIERHEVIDSPIFRHYEWECPLPVHIAFCEWCSSHVDQG